MIQKLPNPNTWLWMNCEWILEWTPFKYPWPSCQIFCHHPAPGGFHSVPAQLPADAKHLMFGNHKYTVVSRSNEECWKPSKPLSRFHTVCPSRKTRTRSSALQNSSLPESLTNQSRCDYQMQYMKENHLKKKIGWPDPPPCHWCHHISGWKSTLSSQPGVITWQFVACFEQKLSLPWLFWQNLGRSSACPRCTHPPRIPGFCITTTSVQVRTSLQKHVSLKLQPQIWKKI